MEEIKFERAVREAEALWRKNVPFELDWTLQRGHSCSRDRCAFEPLFFDEEWGTIQLQGPPPAPDMGVREGKPTFVCRGSGQAHVCGSACTFATESDGVVACPLTGLIVGSIARSSFYDPVGGWKDDSWREKYMSEAQKRSLADQDVDNVSVNLSAAEHAAAARALCYSRSGSAKKRFYCSVFHLLAVYFSPEKTERDAEEFRKLLCGLESGVASYSAMCKVRHEKIEVRYVVDCSLEAFRKKREACVPLSFTHELAYVLCKEMTMECMALWSLLISAGDASNLRECSTGLPHRAAFVMAYFKFLKTGIKTDEGHWILRPNEFFAFRAPCEWVQRQMFCKVGDKTRETATSKVANEAQKAVVYLLDSSRLSPSSLTVKSEKKKTFFAPELTRFPKPETKLEELREEDFG